MCHIFRSTPGGGNQNESPKKAEEMAGHGRGARTTPRDRDGGLTIFLRSTGNPSLSRKGMVAKLLAHYAGEVRLVRRASTTDDCL